ncbi:MAG: polyribonucleotide nucleotidyltransferase [Verrucomicrobia bacterium]|nr:polyribonucleotide nucleotidyltransferase [Verrucomicrobiota bacterium]
MKNATTVSINVGGKEIVLGAGLLAQQAAGAVTARLGDTVLLSAITCTDVPREGIDYFPLQVEYREKAYAAGRFPGGYFKREAKPADKETLTARLTDRPIRPMFPDYYRNDVQINNTVMSADAENDADILSIIASSTSLTISEIPFLGPLGGVRVGRIEGKFVLNPTQTERTKSDLDLIYVSTRDLPMMIEGSAREISEKDLIAAMRLAHAECVKIIDAQLELRKKLGLPEKKIVEPQQDKTIVNAARELSAGLADVLLVVGKIDRIHKVKAFKEDLKAKLLAKFPEMTDEQFRSAFDEIEIETVRANALQKGKRCDGRGFDDLRPLEAQVGLLPRAHGSALFSRGETQALGTVTLGTKSDAQTLDAITGGPDEKKFILHYNFPPYSTGEVGRLGSTGRREIGHGALSERSLAEVVPADYPYTVRVVSDIMGSNGSSSMASVCVGTLAMMDAGIPIRKPVAGISIGLFSDEKKAILVTDIIGQEDHCGDMDFKVAGTRDGITGFQVDLKVRGLKWELVEGAFEKARVARGKILDYMGTIIAAPRPEMSQYAPRITTIMIDPEKIGALIGPGGKNIRRITELSGAQIDIDDSGTVNIFATDGESMKIAVAEVNMITAEVEEGKIYEGTVTGIKEFGAFVEVLPGKEGLVHISELADVRVNRTEDVCKIGDRLWVKCIGIDDRGRVKLSRKQAMRERGEQR